MRTKNEKKNAIELTIIVHLTNISPPPFLKKSVRTVDSHSQTKAV